MVAAQTRVHIGAQPAETAVIEPRVGGRWFERGVDGSECNWGHVLVWDPPQRLVLSWEIGCDWRQDVTLKTEVEVRFIADGPKTTTVELEHRNLDALEQGGNDADSLRSDGGWSASCGLCRGGRRSVDEFGCQRAVWRLRAVFRIRRLAGRQAAYSSSGWKHGDYILQVRCDRH